MSGDMPTYEMILHEIENLSTATSSVLRHVTWLDAEGRVGLARAHDRGLEIMLDGPRVSPSVPVVQKAIEYLQFYRTASSLEPHSFSRIVLPDRREYEQVAALICAELLRNDAVHDLRGAFRRTESLIALVVAQETETAAAYRDLVAQLVVLRALLAATDVPSRNALVTAWNGRRGTRRSFSWNGRGLVVLATEAPDPRHRVGIEGTTVSSGEAELRLVSVSLDRNPPSHEDADCLPELLDSIFDLVPSPEARGELSSRVKQFAPQLDYDHSRDWGDPYFRVPWRVRFARCFDPADERLGILNTEHLTHMTAIRPESVRFELILPGADHPSCHSLSDVAVSWSKPRPQATP